MMSDDKEESILIFSTEKEKIWKKARKSLEMGRHKVFDLPVVIQTVKSIHLS